MTTRTIARDDLHRPPGKGAPFRMSWGALFAGAATALSVWLLLYVLGIALGVSRVDPNVEGTGLWDLATPLVALFIGGAVASRSAGPLGRIGGVLHGLVVWSLTALGVLWLVANLFGGVLGTAVETGTTAVQTGTNVATPIISDESARFARSDMLSGRLEGGIGRPEEGIGRPRVRAARQMIPGEALDVAPRTATAFWVLFGALFLGALSAMGGGAAGVTREQRWVVEAEAAQAAAGVGGGGLTQPILAQPIVGAVPPPIPPNLVREPEVAELRSEIALLRSELREVLSRTDPEDLRH